MAKINVKIPEPKEQYDTSNQKQINRSITTIIEQLNSTYLDEIKHFITCIKKRKFKTKIPYDIGVSTMKLIHAAETSHKTGKRINII